MRSVTVAPCVGEEDRVLVARAADGDGDAFTELYRRHVGRVTARVRSKLGDPQWADDVVQETWERVYACLGDYDPGKGEFGQWLAGVADWAITQHVRAQWRARQAVAAAVEMHTFAAPAGPVAGELSEKTTGLLAKLDPERQQALTLLYVEGLPAETAARVMGRKVSAVNWLRSTAVRRLRRELTKPPVRPAGSPLYYQRSSGRWVGTVVEQTPRGPRLRYTTGADHDQVHAAWRRLAARAGN